MQNPRARSFTCLVFLALAAASARAQPVRFSQLGLSAGTVEHLVADPFDPQGVYAAVDSGIYRSGDAGRSWSFIGAAPSIGLNSLAAGRGEPGELYASSFSGIFRSRDGGATWQSMPWDFNAPLEVLVDPFDALTLYAATVSGGNNLNRGVFKSTDGGESWTRFEVFFSTFLDMELDPVTPGLIYLSMGDSFLRSTDGGETWTYITAAAFSPRSITTDGVTLLISVGSRVFRSFDQGTTYELLPAEVPGAGLGGGLLWDVTFGTIFALTGRAFFSSTDEGASWQVNETVGPAAAIEAGPDGRLWAGSFGRGVYRSGDGGQSWEWSSQGIHAGEVTALAVSGEEGMDGQSILYAGLGRGGFRRSFDGGETWEWPGREVDFVSLFDLVIDPNGPATVYGAGEDGVWRSRDRGESWELLGAADLPFGAKAVAIDSAAPGSPHAGQLYATSGGTFVFRSRDGGATWSEVLDGGFTDTSATQPILAHPSRGGTLYTGAKNGATHAVFMTEDGGETWEEVLVSEFSGQFQDLAVDPRNPGTVYAAARLGLFKSENGGRDWRRVLARRYIESFVIDPGDSATLWVGTGRELMRSLDGGETWAPVRPGAGDPPGLVLSSEGLALDVRALVIDPRRPSRLVAGMGGLGMVAVDTVVERTETLLLQDGRFEVTVEWRDAGGGRGRGAVAQVEGAGALPLASKDSAVASFFSPENWEMLLKVLDGTAVNERFWVFLAAATDVGYEVEVIDTHCGGSKLYRNEPGRRAPAVTDTDAFGQCIFIQPPAPSCFPDEDTFCFGPYSRFEARIRWDDGRGGRGVGSQAVIPRPGLAQSEDSGLFYFFSEENWEFLVKVLDGCSVNGHFWVFGAATTDVEYTLTVTDTATGETSTYFNPLGNAADAINDTAAFATCTP